ncbi:MAG TPA: hypothetical protein VNS22_27530 [Geminicoccus sp.]|nr:hypothetical protein [Geminicoccus sp.]HWL72111.1 hypothetical protein [Geminicoccus sp.]
MASGETVLAMAQRHLREGQQRVADQQAQVAVLEQAGHEACQSRAPCSRS